MSWRRVSMRSPPSELRAGVARPCNAVITDDLWSGDRGRTVRPRHEAVPQPDKTVRRSAGFRPICDGSHSGRGLPGPPQRARAAGFAWAQMLERYKLRLRDGTVLVVDHDALSSWLVDGRAMVQPVGSERWQSLKAFLAKERVEARSAAWRNPAPETPVPVTPPRPRDDERAFRPVPIPPL